MEAKILVCCHKQDVMETQAPYYPIQVGKAISGVDLGITGDDTGDNISDKNASYCELTGMYWAWKNLKNVDVVGLCHYRRYFDFHNQCPRYLAHVAYPTSDFDKINRQIPDEILQKVKDGYVVCVKPKYYLSLKLDYANAHISDDMRVLRSIIKETQDEAMQQAFFKVMNGSELMHYNMFMMSRADYDEYCSWLFGILAEAEKRIDISHYSPVQRRIFGYMAERLFNVWLYAKKQNKVIKKSILWFIDNPKELRRDTLIHHLIYNWRIRFANFISRPRRFEL
jgi:hypothetical protein